MRKAKRLTLMLALTFCLLMMYVYPVSAASSVTGGVGGYSTSGSITMGSTSATGYTSSGAPGAILTVTVSYEYGWGTLGSTYTVTRSNGGANYGVSVTAAAEHYNPYSIRTDGTHSVTYGSAYWSDTTSIR